MKENTEGKSPVEDDEKLSKEKKKVEKEGTFKKDWDWQGCRYWGGVWGVSHTPNQSGFATPLGTGVMFI